MGINWKSSSAQDELENLVNDLRGVLSSRDLDDIPQIKQIRDKVESGLKSARKATVKAAEDAAEYARDGADIANRYAHNEPWQVAGAAVVIGALIGFLLARR